MDYVAILELYGGIRKNLSLNMAKSLIDETFRIDGLKAVLLEIDSPDGSSFEFFLVLLSHNYVMMWRIIVNSSSFKCDGKNHLLPLDDGNLYPPK